MFARVTSFHLSASAFSGSICHIVLISRHITTSEKFSLRGLNSHYSTLSKGNKLKKNHSGIVGQQYLRTSERENEGKSKNTEHPPN